MRDKEKIRLQQWWMEQLRDLTRKVMKEEEKRQAKVTAKASAMLSEYSSRDDIVEAYGMGIITEKQMDKVLDMWDQANEGHSEIYEGKIALLQEAYEEAQRIMQELGQGV